jgi:hypothetical protein
MCVSVCSVHGEREMRLYIVGGKNCDAVINLFGFREIKRRAMGAKKSFGSLCWVQ